MRTKINFPWKPFLLFFLFLFVTEASFRWSSLAQKAIHEKRYTALAYDFAKNPVHPEIVFLGDSRTIHGVSSHTIEQILQNELQKKWNVMNLGLPGAPPMTHFAWVGHLLKRKQKPRLVVIQLSPYMFSSLILKTLSRESIPSLYLASDAWNAFRAGMPLEDVFHSLTCNLFSTLRYRRQLQRHFSFRDKIHPPAHLGKKGHKGLRGSLAKTQQNRAYSRAYGYKKELSLPKAKLNQEQFRFFSKTLQRLTQEKIQVLVILSPVSKPLLRNHNTSTLFPQIFQEIQKITQKQNVTLTDHRQPPLLKDLDFVDGDHLNSAGARLYSAWLAHHSLLPLLSTKSVIPNRWTPQKASRKQCDVLFDWEEKKNTQWKFTGNAFRVVAGAQGDQWPFQNVQGLQLLNSYSPIHGDRATGTALSQHFVLQRNFIEFWIAGGKSPDLSVELLHNNQVIQKTTGTNSEHLQKRIWRVEAWKGKQLQIRITDRETKGWGHLMVDHFEQCFP